MVESFVEPHPSRQKNPCGKEVWKNGTEKLQSAKESAQNNSMKTWN